MIKTHPTSNNKPQNRQVTHSMTVTEKPLRISMKFDLSPNLYETIMSHISQKDKTTIITNIALVIRPEGRLHILHIHEIGEPILG